MRILLYVFFLNIISPSTFAAKICYFSLNNSNEFIEIKKLSDKLNKYAKEKIEVVEFLTPNGVAEESFQKMVESNVKCDGLVISGHHTGSFGGKNTPTNLHVDFMEKLSCDPKNIEFFNHIKALWLQGCRTQGVGTIETYESADFHTERVGDVLAADNLHQSFADLNMEFSATLDKDNPLSSRYLRIFPRATTFGWTETAPGEKARSELSIPFHIANIARLNDDRGRYFDNPVGEEISPASAIRYIKAMEIVLDTALFSPLKPCQNLRDEKLSTEGWIRHGSKGVKNPKYSFDNPDLIAYESLFKSKKEILKSAKSLECILKNTNDVDALIPMLDEILKSEGLLNYSFNSIHELLLRFRDGGNIKSLTQLQDKLKASPLLQNFLMRKLASREIGILRKIDYYAFWKDLTGETDNKVEELIDQEFLKLALAPLNNNVGRRDYLQTLFESLGKHGLLKGKTLNEISSKTDSIHLKMVIKAIQESETGIENVNGLLNTILNSEKADLSVFKSVAEAIANSNLPIKDAEEILNKIVNSEKADPDVFRFVAAVIGNSTLPIKDAEEILNKIVNSEKADGSVFRRVAEAIGESKSPIKNAEKILNKIINSEVEVDYIFKTVVQAIGDSKSPIKDVEEILKKIVNSEKADVYVFQGVAQTIGNSKSPIKDAEEILNKIVNSKKTHPTVLQDVSATIGKSKFPIKDAEKILNNIINSEKTDSNTLAAVVEAIKNSKSPIKDVEEILNKIVNSEKAESSILEHVARVVGDSKSSIKAAEEILIKIMNSKKVNSSVLLQVAVAIGNSTSPIKGTEEILKEILNSEKTESIVLQAVAFAIEYSKYPIKDAEKILTKIVNSEKTKLFVLMSVVNAIEKSKSPIKEREEILKVILNSKKADSALKSRIGSLAPQLIQNL